MNSLKNNSYAILILCTLIGCSEKSIENQSGITPPPPNTPPTVSQLNNHNNAPYTEIKWTDLLPDKDLDALKNPPKYLAEINEGSEEDLLSGKLKAENPNTEISDVEMRPTPSRCRLLSLIMRKVISLVGTSKRCK